MHTAISFAVLFDLALGSMQWLEHTARRLKCVLIIMNPSSQCPHALLLLNQSNTDIVILIADRFASPQTSYILTL